MEFLRLKITLKLLKMELQKLKAKDVQKEMNVCLTTAKKYLKDIKTEFNIKIVTKHHLQTYLKVQK